MGQPDHAAARPTGVRFIVLSLACGASFVLYLHRYVWGMVKPDLQKEFGWDERTSGSFDSLFAASYGLSQIPSGIACDWFGARRLLGASIFCWSAALLVATVTGGSGVFASRMAFGVFQAGCYAALNKVSKNWFPRTMRSTAQGWIATFFGRGGGAASFLLFGTVLVGWAGFSWRGAVAVFGLAGFAFAAVFAYLFRNTPREHPWSNAAEAELILQGDPQAILAVRSRLDWGLLVRCPTVWCLSLRAVASNMADVVFVYWLPLYLRGSQGLGSIEAGWMAALPLLGGACGGAASGWLQSRLLMLTGDRRWSRNGVGLGGKSIAAALMLGSLGIRDPAVVACVFLAVKFFSDCEQPAEWGAVTDIAGKNAATVFACVNTFGSLGGVLGSLSIGHILASDAGRPTAAAWTTVFVITAVEYMVAAAVWLFIDSRRPIVPEPEAPHRP